MLLCSVAYEIVWEKFLPTSSHTLNYRLRSDELSNCRFFDGLINCFISDNHWSAAAKHRSVRFIRQLPVSLHLFEGRNAFLAQHVSSFLIIFPLRLLSLFIFLFRIFPLEMRQSNHIAIRRKEWEENPFIIASSFYENTITEIHQRFIRELIDVIRLKTGVNLHNAALCRYLLALACSDTIIILTSYFLFFLENMRKRSKMATYWFAVLMPGMFPLGLTAQTLSGMAIHALMALMAFDMLFVTRTKLIIEKVWELRKNRNGVNPQQAFFIRDRLLLPK